MGEKSAETFFLKRLHVSFKTPSRIWKTPSRIVLFVFMQYSKSMIL